MPRAVARQRGERGDLDRGEQRVADARDAERVGPGVERELLPDEVEAAHRVVEREDEDDRDRHEQVEQRQQRIDVQRPIEQLAAAAAAARPAASWVRVAVGAVAAPASISAAPLGAQQRLGARDARPDQHDRQHHRHQDERQRRRGRVVADLEVAALDDVADHVLVRRAEQLGVDEVAGRRDEREQGAGHDARHRERQGDAQEDVAPAAVEVVARLQQAVVDPLQRGVERQDHERQEVVGDACHHRERRVEQAAVLAQDPDRLQRVDHEPGVGQDRLPRERADR